MTTWIEPSDLLALVAGLRVRGAEAVTDVVMRRPTELIPVTEPALPPLDIATYEVRLERWQQGEGPHLTGIEDLVAALRTLREPARAACVSGKVTTYAYVLDSALTRAIAAVAIDPPMTGTGP
ncbi:hypothetical protein [Nocardioides sp.]|uniref:hypothetical protein n=1 Tax=Nocardioides sp. TaxID=35761 RepID=UPI003514B94D